MRGSGTWCLDSVKKAGGKLPRLSGEASARSAGNAGLVSGLGRSPAGGSGDPLQDSCLEKRVDRGAWRATVHGVAKSQTQLSMHTQKEDKEERKEDLCLFNHIGMDKICSCPQLNIRLCKKKKKNVSKNKEKKKKK